MITIKDLSFSYGNNAVLKQISMELLPGNIYGLLGENGVGKTTLLTLLCGLKKPQVGTIDIDGFKPYDRKPSLLSEIYYLSDEVAEITMCPMEFAKNYGKFWSHFSLETFGALIELFEVPKENRMDKQVLAVQMENVSKYFGGICAVNNVSLEIRKGTIHSLMGENGAGKSTLMKMLCGIISTEVELCLLVNCVHPAYRLSGLDLVSGLD